MIRNSILVLFALAMVVPPVQAADPPDRVYEVDVTLVSCAVCRKKIKEIFMGIENVKEVDFDLETKKAIVTMKGDKTLALTTVDEAFKLSKFVVKGMTERKAAESRPAPKPEKKPEAKPEPAPSPKG